MKQNLKIIAFVVCLTLTFSASAQNKSVIQKYDEISNMVSGEYKNKLDLLVQRLKDAAEEAGDIQDCHDQKRVYSSAGCQDPITPETDPTKANHAAVTNNITTCPSGRVHHWNGSSWSCKEIRKKVNSGVGADKMTWHTSGYESCADYFVRPCNSGDDTCPGKANPVTNVCDGSVKNCRYVLPNNKQFMIATCR